MERQDSNGLPLRSNEFKALELEKSMEQTERSALACTRDGSMVRHGRPASKNETGGWRCGMTLLVNQALLTLAFAGVEVNMVLFAKLVLRQSNEEASNTFNRWLGTSYLFCLVGAFLSDSYLGRYLTCVVFQLIVIIGMVALSLITQAFLHQTRGCGQIGAVCEQHSPLQLAMFYVAIYLIALGYGGQDPSLATFGADQFDEEDPKEKQSKTSFFSYFYVALNGGCLVAETILVYIEDAGYWLLVFWICATCSVLSYVSLLSGTPRYRHFKPSGNPISRFSQVLVASFRKMSLEVPPNGEGLYEVQGGDGDRSRMRKILHTNNFKFLDRAAIANPTEMSLESAGGQPPNPWCLCTVTQVEEVKCLIRLLPIWVCTFSSSFIYIQTLSLFVEQGAAMDTTISNFHFPPASMTAFDMVATTTFILLYEKVIFPFIVKVTKRTPQPPSDLQRIGIGLGLGIVSLIVAGIVEQKRLKHANGSGKELSSLGILWQTPQYILLGVSEALVVVAQMEFFSSQTPDRLKSMGMALSMSSTAIGSYISSFFLSVVMELTSRNGKPGWVPQNLNEGHLDRYFFLSAGLVALCLGLYVVYAKRYKSISLEKRATELTQSCGQAPTCNRS
ncbi:hypothetical protein K2173_025008 [Erythroxylum novogranatense]|uniref:Uncharacterized protein n=1 Tax=Erythroxylum novogranatense TaxID=1862640 RepID=A0AAV8UH25_9ROSI|nr:hypothetical protein K2173_025008 [Erythroxylum novogranatense]